MDNPQHYQPLSHALNPPVNSQSHQQPTFTAAIFQTKTPVPVTDEQDDEDDEEGDEDDEDVEEQLSRTEPDTQSSVSPAQNRNSNEDSGSCQQNISQIGPEEPERKRRPGRPRGSKNRKPRVGSSRHEGLYYQGQPSVGPPHLSDINPQNHQYYEFQWRVLNLCAEFYGAAEELVKATSPMVIAQCYHMGPGVKVDPLTMLTEAKRVCDTLLANPSQLVSQPPPQMYPGVHAFYPASAVSMPSSASSSIKSNTTPIITNPQSFVVPLTTQPTGYSHAQYSVYTSGQYPTTPYYHQYYTGTYYPPPQPPPPPPSQPVPVAQPPQASVPAVSASPPVLTNATTSAIGAWSDEETERLKRLAEESRSIGIGGEIEWDRVVHQWGNTRTRHQILLKATSLGLKESSGRLPKRRRENESETAPSPSLAGTPAPSTTQTTTTTLNTAASNQTPSPSHSQATSTPAASPALQHQHQQQTQTTASKNMTSTTASQGTTSTTTTLAMPWSMSTMSTSTPSPVIGGSAAAAANQDHRTSYYRPRPIDNAQRTATMPIVHHPYMYQPPSNNGVARNVRENGK